MLAILGHAAVVDRAIKLKVSPQISFAPSRLQVQVRVHPMDEDRWIRVELDGENFYRASEFTVSDHPLYSWPIPDVPAGAYDVVAAIGHANQVRASDRTTVIVQGF